MKGYLDEQMIESPAAFWFMPGLSFGKGIFETLQVMEGRVLFHEEHLERMLKSAAVLGLSFPVSLEETIVRGIALVQENGLENGALKIVLFQGTEKTHLAMLTDGRVYLPEQYEEGTSLCLATQKLNDTSPLAGHKTLNYWGNLLEKEKAGHRGFHDAIFLTTRNHVAETAVANIFWIAEGNLWTPSLACGILPGIVREKVLEIAGSLGVSVRIGKYSLRKIMHAEAVFITNSLMGIMPVARIEKTTFLVRHPLLEGFRVSYEKLKKSEKPAENQKEECFVYIVECADGSYYTGWTNQLQQRLDTHNRGRGARYTRSRLPVKLAYQEKWGTREEAMKREAAIKKMSRAGKERLIGNKMFTK